MTLMKIALGAVGLASTVAAHGHIDRVTVNGKEYVQRNRFNENSV
jgi:hypothetical protein